jgi:CDP-glucose 4,6-dehydratase
MGTAYLLEALRKQERACHVVVVTTDKVYENFGERVPKKESDRLGGHDPYSSSKACAEIIVNSYRQSFFPPGAYSSHGKAIATARAGNVIGGGDWAECRLMPDLVRSAEAGEKIGLRYPDAVRPWQHVLDPLAGYLLLGLRLREDPARFSGAFNFGPELESQISVRALVQVFVECWGGGEFYEDGKATSLQESEFLMLDNAKARKELGWVPKLGCRDAVVQTVDWYRNYRSDPLGRLIGQIENYFEDSVNVEMET